MEQKGDGNGQALTHPEHEPGHHPNQVKHHFKPGQSGNPAGRPKGIPNLNDRLITAMEKFKVGRGKKARGFFEELLRIALKGRGRKDLLEQLLDKALADATPRAGAQLNVNSDVNNGDNLHQYLLHDSRVTDAASRLEEAIGRSIIDARGNGKARK